jgi:hypothetical protein
MEIATILARFQSLDVLEEEELIPATSRHCKMPGMVKLREHQILKPKMVVVTFPPTQCSLDVHKKDSTPRILELTGRFWWLGGDSKM